VATLTNEFRHTWIFAYDVRSDARRSRLANILLAWGYRIQLSVFELTLTDREFARIKVELESVVDPDTDTVSAFRQCVSCCRATVRLGQAVEPRATWWIVA